MAASNRDTRARLLEATSELLWSGSFHAAGVDEICRRADVRKGSFYHFFPSKADLAIEAVRAGWEHVRDSLFEPVFRTGAPGLARLKALVHAIDRLQRREFEARGVYLGCPFGSLGQEMAHQDERLQGVASEVFEGHVDYFERALREAAEAGEVEPGDLRGRARRILALMEGALLLAKVARRPAYFTEIVRALPAIARRDTDVSGTP